MTPRLVIAKWTRRTKLKRNVKNSPAVAGSVKDDLVVPAVVRTEQGMPLGPVKVTGGKD